MAQKNAIMECYRKFCPGTVARGQSKAPTQMVRASEKGGVKKGVIGAKGEI